jgi:uncharacterized membrane protein YdjX (TVP38/TMEM64 family)
MQGLLLLLALLLLTSSSGFRASWQGRSTMMRVPGSKDLKIIRGMHLKQASDSDQSMTMSKKDEGTGDEIGDQTASELKKRYVVVPLLTLLIGGLAWVYSGNSPLGVVDMNHVLDRAVERIAASGPYGYLYFSLVYIAAEMLAIPVFPLTASSGYLFGLFPGYCTVLVSATLAAMASFFIGRTLLREWAMQFTSKWPKWTAIDKAIAKEGLKVITLLRLSPLLPFSLSNYLYGITSVDFWSFSVGTLLGFAPGTFGIVYAGSAGKVLFDPEAGVNAPWYVLAAGGGLVVFAARTLAKVATEAIAAMEDEMRANGELPPVEEDSADKTPL